MGSRSLELLEHYQADPRGPSALFLAFTNAGEPLHAVIGLSTAGFVVIVALYRPRADLWYDWRRRV